MFHLGRATIQRIRQAYLGSVVYIAALAFEMTVRHFLEIIFLQNDFG